MKKRILFISIAVIIIISALLATQIVNNNIAMRSGKGSFYPVVSVLKKGANVTILENGESWKKVKTTIGKEGWVSANAFEKVGGTIDYGMMAKDISDKKASTTMVTAAVKGFFENKLGDESLNKDIFQHPRRNYVNPSLYMKFKKDTYAGGWSAKKFQRKYKISKPKPFIIDESLFAVSAYVVAKLTAYGVITDPKKLHYVNNIAQLIAENTEYYDLPICVHIANTDKLFINALPIGVTVVYNGMLKECKNESELACLLGHEISHITLQHGSVEMGKRKVKLKAEDAFGELDKAFGTDTKEMDELSDEMYERSIKGRKEKYEMAADHMGVIYAYRAGYDVRGLPNVMRRLESQMPRSRNMEDVSHWFPYSFKKRIASLEKFINKKLKDRDEYKKFEARFEKNIY